MVSGHHVPHLRHFVPDLSLSLQIQLEHELCEHTMYALPQSGVIVQDAVGLRKANLAQEKGEGQCTDLELAKVVR